MATPAALRAAPATGSPSNPLAQLGMGLWRLLTSVDFAVIQIIFLSMLAVVGMTLQQMPDFAFRSPGDYATAIENIHIRYDPVLGPGVVNVLERLGAFAIFKSAVFGVGLVVLVVSIVVCTLDRTPRLWRDVSVVRVVQPEPYYDPASPRSRRDDRGRRRGRGTRRSAAAASTCARPPRPTGRGTCTATGTSTRRWPRSSPTPASSCSCSRPR